MAKKYRRFDASQRKKMADVFGGLPVPMFMFALVAGIVDTRLSRDAIVTLVVSSIVFFWLSVFFAKEDVPEKKHEPLAERIFRKTGTCRRR